jgi:hypothetical protein
VSAIQPTYEVVPVVCPGVGPRSLQARDLRRAIRVRLRAAPKGQKRSASVTHSHAPRSRRDKFTQVNLEVWRSGAGAFQAQQTDRSRAGASARAAAELRLWSRLVGIVAVTVAVRFLPADSSIYLVLLRITVEGMRSF